MSAQILFLFAYSLTEVMWQRFVRFSFRSKRHWALNLRSWFLVINFPSPCSNLLVSLALNQNRYLLQNLFLLLYNKCFCVNSCWFLFIIAWKNLLQIICFAEKKYNWYTLITFILKHVYLEYTSKQCFFPNQKYVFFYNLLPIVQQLVFNIFTACCCWKPPT